MLSIHIDSVGDLAIVECKGKIAFSEATCKLREAVTSQRQASVVLLDLSGVYAVEDGGLTMLSFLQRWAQEHDVRLKLFNPVNYVRFSLQRANPMQKFDIARLDEVMALLTAAHSRAHESHALAA